MSVKVIFECDVCRGAADGTDHLRVKLQSFSGRGFGRVIQANTVRDITPAGWVAYDPYTYATYCPQCWSEIESIDGPEAQR